MKTIKYEYDIDALLSFSELDAAAAISSFSGNSAYFEMLDEYVERCGGYLRDYNPTVVIYGEDVRREFTSELNEISDFIAPLNLTIVNMELNNLREVLEANDAKTLSDGLLKFHATLEITADRIVSARLGELLPVIIAVDDTPEILASLQGILGSSFKVVGVTSASNAIKAAKQQPPSMFLIDIAMPETDGFQLVEIIRESGDFNDIPILFLTSTASRDNVLMAKRLGVKDYILKPPNKDTLLRKIKAYI